MGADRLGDLEPGRQVRRERADRVLWDERDARAEDAAARRGAEREQVGAREAAPRRPSRERTAAEGRAARECVADLPDPDSPTIASVSPGRTENDAPRTAWNGPDGVANVTRRSRTARSAPGLGEDGLSRDRRAARPASSGSPRPSASDLGSNASRTASPSTFTQKSSRPRTTAGVAISHGRTRTAVTESTPGAREHAERHLRRLDAEAEERQERLEEEDARDRQRERDEDDGQQVREQVPAHDPAVRRAERAGGLDEAPLAQRERLRRGRAAPSSAT